MSREIFELADPDGEDYFNFSEQPRQSAPVSSSSRNQQQSRPPRSQASRSHVFNLGDDSDKEEEDIIDYLDIPHAQPIQDSAPVRKGKKSTASASSRASRSAIHDYMSPDHDLGGEQHEPARKIPAKSVAEHQTLMLTLQRYAASQRFAPMLKEAGLKLTNLESKTVAELKSLQIRVRTVCSSDAGATGFVSSMILGGSSVVESRMPKKLMDLDGFSSSLSSDPEFAAVCEMLELDMGFAAAMTPMQRMGVCLGKHAIKVNGINKSRDKMLQDLMAQQARQQQQQPAVYQPVFQVAPPPPPAPVLAAPVPISQPIVQPDLPAIEPNGQQPIRSRIRAMYD